MARKTSTITTCDREGCRSYSEVADPDRDAPAGWLRVTIASPFVTSTGEQHRYEPKTNSFEFCSEGCVAKWANERRKFTEKPTRSSNGNHAVGAEEQIRAVYLALQEVAGTDQGTITVSEIVGLTGIEKSTVGRRLTTLIDRGIATEVVERRGPFPARYALVEGAGAP